MLLCLCCSCRSRHFFAFVVPLGLEVVSGVPCEGNVLSQAFVVPVGSKVMIGLLLTMMLPCSAPSSRTSPHPHTAATTLKLRLLPTQELENKSKQPSNLHSLQRRIKEIFDTGENF
ncbi:hypothetical protein M5K25_017726 [Dendrobium thyrsiflorum]|uniref:Secreted protein n=1 Tax=Dendrobium thyrsiflorum TaxID=117978 RepID=A0ABD0UNS0_DENTH